MRSISILLMICLVQFHKKTGVIMFNVSNTIRKLMIDKNTPITPLARSIGVTQPNLSRKINNPDEDYKIEYLNSICSALGCKLEINIIDSKSDKILYTLGDE